MLSPKVLLLATTPWPTIIFVIFAVLLFVIFVVLLLVIFAICGMDLSDVSVYFDNVTGFPKEQMKYVKALFFRRLLL